MNVLMDQDLLDLYQDGKSKKYKEIERNRELLGGFIRAVKMITEDGIEVELIDIDNTHYGNKK